MKYFKLEYVSPACRGHSTIVTVYAQNIVDAINTAADRFSTENLRMVREEIRESKSIIVQVEEIT